MNGILLRACARTVRTDHTMDILYMGSSLIRNTPQLGPHIRTIPRVLWWSEGGGGAFLMSEATLQPVHLSSSSQEGSMRDPKHGHPGDKSLCPPVLGDLRNHVLNIFSALEATQGQMHGLFGQLPCKCHLEEVATVRD